jgi:hypothetical protein
MAVDIYDIHRSPASYTTKIAVRHLGQKVDSLSERLERFELCLHFDTLVPCQGQSSFLHKVKRSYDYEANGGRVHLT